jgi:hypothetical protein
MVPLHPFLSSLLTFLLADIRVVLHDFGRLKKDSMDIN